MPDLAIVPMFSITSSRVMPMPLSRTVSVRASASQLDVDGELRVAGQSSGAASASKRSWSLASEALEISSRRKISRLL